MRGRRCQRQAVLHIVTSTSRLIPLSGRRSKHGRYANTAIERRLEVRVILRAVRELIDGA
jgi:hypothetical protein